MPTTEILYPDDSMARLSGGKGDANGSQDQLAVYKAVADAENFGKNPIETYNESMAVPSEVLKKQLASDYKQVSHDALSKIIEDVYNSNPGEVGDVFVDANGIKGEIDSEADSPSGPEKYLVSTLSRAPEATDLQKRLANQAYYSRRIKELVSDQDWKDWATNVGGMLVLNDLSLDISRVAKGDADESAWQSYFSSAENWSKFISAWHAMPPEQQRHDFDILVDLLQEATDENTLKTVGYLQELLDPTSQPSAQTWQALDKAFAGLDVVGAGGLGVGLVMGRLAGPVRLAKVAKSLDNLEAGAKITEVAIADEKAAKAVGMTQTEAVATASPVKMETFINGAPDGIAQRIKLNFEALDAHMELDNLRRFGLELTPEAQQAAIAKKIRELEAKPDVSEVSVVGVAGDGYKLQYSIQSPDGSTARITDEIAFTRDDIEAGFNTGETGVGGAFTRFISSPNFLFGQDRGSLVNKFTSILFEQEKAKTHFATAFKQIYKGLDKHSIDKLNLVLAKGRDLEKEYTYADLVGTGILTEKEFVAYANTRHMMDKAFHFKNKEVYDLSQAQGLKEIHLGNGVRELMRPYETKDGAVAALNQSLDKVAFVPDPIGGTLREVKLDATTLSEYYDKGYRLVRKAEDKYVKGFDDNYYPFALVKNDNVAELPRIILKKREAGYMPIEYKEGLYFVKQAVKGKVAGVTRDVDTKTLRYFNNRQDAETFARQLAEGGEVNASDLRVVHDRELTRDELGDELIGVHGGLYTGSRGQDELLFGLDGTKGPKVDPLESMAKYFSNIATRYPMSKYRLAIQQQWMNEAKKSWGLPVKFDGSFEQARNFIGSTKDLTITERAMAEKAHDHIAFQMRVPTNNEREVQTWMRTVAEKIETVNLPGNRKLARAIHRFDHTNPIASVRASAFNLAMGWYNPAPFLVQALGSTVAMSLDPLRVPKHLTSTFALQAMDMMHSPHALDLNAGKMAKSLNDKDLPDLKKAWDMSGLKESAMFGHADYQAMAKGLPLDKGVLRGLWDNQTYFYKTGELFNYRYSFSAAFDWWKRQPGNKKRTIDAKAVDEIVARTNTYLLHMSRANRSTAQKGAFSIPTQFTKIFSAFAEAMTGKELTLKEKVSLMDPFFSNRASVIAW